MKRNLALGLFLSVATWLVGAGYCRSQEAPEPPVPPDAPEVFSGNLESQLLTAEGDAWLGVTLKDVTAEKARDLKLPGEYGALVQSVDADSAAAKAGLQKGDVIVEFAGERVRSEAQLRRLIHETPSGRTVSLQVIRDRQARTLSAKLQSRTNQFFVQAPEMHIPEINIAPNLVSPYLRGFASMFDGRPSLGISGEELTTQLANYFGVKQGKGVLVSEVVVGSPAATSGLKAGDVIVAVDGKGVATVAELRKALEIKSGEEKRKLNLTIVREHHEQTVPVELERPNHLEHEKEVAGLGIDTAEWQRIEAQARAQMKAAQLALEEAQKHLGDQQRVLSESMRRAAEKYRQAVREQLKEELKDQIRKQVETQVMQSVSL